MIKIPYKDIIARIKDATNLPEQEIEGKVDDKLKQLSGLVSREGAAHIIANEYGVRLFEQLSGRLEIKNILPGMRNVETIGRATQIFEERTFQTENRTGRVGSFILSDQTGSIRIVLWGEQCNHMRSLNPGALVKISGGYVKENNNRKEVHLNDKAQITVNPVGIEFPEINPGQRKYIKDLSQGDMKVEVLATIVQVFDPKFFEVCPVCSKRARLKDDKFECVTHGAVNPEYSYVTNCFIDDGTDNIRAVFFREQTQQLAGKDHMSILSFRDNIENFSQIKSEILGKLVKIMGKTQRNEMFDRLEFIVDVIDMNPNPDAEIALLQKEIDKAGLDNRMPINRRMPGNDGIPGNNAANNTKTGNFNTAGKDEINISSETISENEELID